MIKSTKHITILGIDPGTNILGFGLVRADSSGPRYIKMGCLDLRKIKDPFDRLANINAAIEEICEEYKPDEMAIESPFTGKNPQVMLKLGRAQGAAIISATKRGIPVTEYAPRKAKAVIAGNGAASKEQVCNMVEKILGIQLPPEHLDATDALSIALCHHFQLLNPISGGGNMSRGMRSSSSWEKFLAANPERIKK